MDEDIYGSLGEGGEGIYDDTRGGKGMRYSEDGLYDNPHAGQGLCTHARTHASNHTHNVLLSVSQIRTCDSLGLSSLCDMH